MNPFCGYIHEQNNCQLPLIYDLSEIIKQRLDQLILEMVNTGQFREEHFNNLVNVLIIPA